MPVLRAADVGTVLRKGGRARVDEPVPPRFTAGERVRTRNVNPLGHTRLPRYARGRQGVIDRDHGVFIFPDTHAMGQGPRPQHCYAVRFAARELWGPEASPRDWIYIDLWDDHLDALQNGGPDMAPIPPTLGSAPAKPGRSSGRLQ